MRRSASSHNIDVSVAVEVTRNQILDGDTAIINDQLLRGPEALARYRPGRCVHVQRDGCFGC